MPKFITPLQLFDGVVSLAKDCIQNNLGPVDMIEFSNGYNSADLYRVLEDSPDLYYTCVLQMMKYEEVKPASRLYIAGFNKKASELGLPVYNSFGILVKIIVCLILLEKTKK